MLSFPVEIWQKILSYLGPEQVAIVRATCEKLRICADSPVIWLRYLNRLKALDKHISVTPPEGNPEGWCYRRFVEEFNKFAQFQYKRIQILRETHSSKPEIKALLITLHGKNGELCNTPATTLEDLENREEILKSINAAVQSQRGLFDLPNQLHAVEQLLMFYVFQSPTLLNIPQALYTPHYGQGFISSSLNSTWNQVTSGEKRTLENDTNLDEENENQNEDDNNHSNNNSNKKQRKN